MDYPELPPAILIQMTPDPEGTPLAAYDENDMRAYVDADRAQRAAPGVQGGEAKERDKVELSSACLDCGGTGMFDSGGFQPWGDAISVPCDCGAATSPQPVAQQTPPAAVAQQSAQPVATIGKVAGCGPNDVCVRWHGSFAKTGDKLYAATQPVEVQRVGLTDAQVEDLRADANRGYCIEREEYFKAFRDAERAHGINPTGTEGEAPKTKAERIKQLQDEIAAHLLEDEGGES